MAFVRGVIERGGERELAAMFVHEHDLPTPAEVDAPGLWIARVNLPADETATDDAPDEASPQDSGEGAAPEAG